VLACSPKPVSTNSQNPPRWRLAQRTPSSLPSTRLQYTLRADTCDQAKRVLFVKQTLVPCDSGNTSTRQWGQARCAAVPLREVRPLHDEAVCDGVQDLAGEREALNAAE